MHNTLNVKQLSVNLGAVLDFTDLNSTLGILSKGNTEKTKIIYELVSVYTALF